jgi:hypothetical protein
LKNSESNLGISPTQAELIVSHRVTLSEKSAKEFDEFMDDLTKNGLVNYGELGTQDVVDENGKILHEGGSDDPQVTFMTEVKKLKDATEGMSLKEAVEGVSRANPKLAEAYLNSQRAQKRKGA